MRDKRLKSSFKIVYSRSESVRLLVLLELSCAIGSQSLVTVLRLVKGAYSNGIGS